MASVLVAGGGGQLGIDLLTALRRKGHDLAAEPSQELNVLERDAFREIVRATGPEVVIDCTMPGGRDLAGDIAAVVTASAEGAWNVAAAAREAGVRSIYISCAEVFDGRGDRPYVESDTPDPNTVLGAAKLAGERAAAAANPRHAIVRLPWLFSVHGSNLATEVVRACAAADRVPVRTESLSFPAYTAHVASVLLALVRRPAYGIFHMTAPAACTEPELARELVRLAGLSCEIDAVARDGGEQRRQLVLHTRRPGILPALPNWREGLRAYVANLAGP